YKHIMAKAIDFADIDVELVRQLRSTFFLNTYEAKALNVLLQHGTLTPAEISVYTKIPKARTYDTLEGLFMRGFILKKKGRPVKYIAKDPETMIAPVIEKMDAIHNSKVQTIKNQEKSGGLISKLKQLFEQRTTKQNLTSYEIFGRSNILSFLKTAITGTKKEILVSYNSAIDIMSAKNDISALLSSAISKEISVKFLTYTNPCALNPNLKECEVKVYPKQLVRFWIFDKTKILLYLNDNPATKENEEACIFIESPIIAAFLGEIFGLLSKEAIPLTK
ncbi:MAG: hypothetical protein COW47_01225, partial [Candidatus Huberarchaeum crystalense]